MFLNSANSLHTEGLVTKRFITTVCTYLLGLQKSYVSYTNIENIELRKSGCESLFIFSISRGDMVCTNNFL